MPVKQSLVQRIRKWIDRQPNFADLLALAGGLIYLIQTIVYIFTSRAMLDEGLYMVKGWFFVTGQYTPFEDYGVLTNHMPLAFLIPGYVLKFFGPTLFVARFYAVVLGLIGLIALWWLARRLAGIWWAAFAVGALALNVALVRIYSLALSQVLVAALLILTLLLSLRRDMRSPHAAAAGLLCGAMLMVRINMLPFAGLWILYIFWQHGRKVGLSALAGMALPVIIVHAQYWPNILRLWAYWIPEGWVTALQPFYSPWDKFRVFEYTPNWGWLTNLDDPTWNPIISFWQGIRFNFVVMVGVLLNLLLWPRRKSWPDAFTMRAAIFLNASFIALTLAHMWASLGGQSCHEFCFSGYVGFFTPLGLLAIVVTAPYWRKELGWAHQLAIAAILLLMAAGIGFGTADDTGKSLAELPIPRPSGSFPLWGIFENKFGITYRDARKVIPALAGLGAGVLLLIGALIWRKRNPARSHAVHALLAFLILGYALAPTKVLSSGDETLQCGGNRIRAYQQAGAQLRPFINGGERLYYHGPNSPAILIYLPVVQIYPPQLNNVFSFDDETTTDPDTLLRFGYWNQELKESWALEADLVLIEARHYGEWQAQVESGELNIQVQTLPLEVCRGEDSSIILLKRND